jgi:hypothetical protein
MLALVAVHATPLPDPPAPALQVRATPGALRAGAAFAIRGGVSLGPATTVELLANPYPYAGFKRVGSAALPAGGAGRTFSFRVVLDRTTRYRVTAPGTAGSPDALTVSALGRTAITSRAITLGRARVSVLVYHPRDLRWGGARVGWSFASGGRRARFVFSPATRSKRLSPYLVKLTTTVTLPAGRYSWRACFKAPLAGALLQRHRLRNCTGRGYAGAGALPVGYPSPAAVARTAGYLATRTGRTAFAVMDSEGRLSGVHLHWTFVSASVVKAMLLVAYLRRLNAEGRHYVDSYSNSFLYPMINVSDNSAATQTWSIVGNAGLYAVARAAHMTDYSVYTDWASSQISAADQARFFLEMDSLIPHEFVGYANRLLSTIAAYESWGIPAVARPRGYEVFFKGGWRTTGLGQLVHQVARLQGDGRAFSIAVMTDGDPSMGYGIDTIEGITASLL